MSDAIARPPEGDWLGTPYPRFERHPPFAQVTVDRPEARNALTQAMYFGIRCAVRRVDADPDLAGLLITGAGDVFIPGGDLGGPVDDKWADFNAAPGAFDVLPFDSLRRPESKEGFAAFIEKRSPSWVPGALRRDARA